MFSYFKSPCNATVRNKSPLSQISPLPRIHKQEERRYAFPAAEPSCYFKYFELIPLFSFYSTFCISFFFFSPLLSNCSFLNLLHLHNSALHFSIFILLAFDLRRLQQDGQVQEVISIMNATKWLGYLYEGPTIQLALSTCRFLDLKKRSRSIPLTQYAKQSLCQVR